jgi:hypothetical protein
MRRVLPVDRKHIAESFPGTGTVPGRAGWTAGRRSCKTNGYPRRGGMARQKLGLGRDGDGCGVQRYLEDPGQGENGAARRLSCSLHAMFPSSSRRDAGKVARGARYFARPLECKTQGDRAPAGARGPAQWIIEKKRDGHELSEPEIRQFINAYANGDLPDYQMSAMAMAIFLRGMNPKEIAVLTDAMMRSGDLVDTSPSNGPRWTNTPPAASATRSRSSSRPLAACCGWPCP